MPSALQATIVEVQGHPHLRKPLGSLSSRSLRTDGDPHQTMQECQELLHLHLQVGNKRKSFETNHHPDWLGMPTDR